MSVKTEKTLFKIKVVLCVLFQFLSFLDIFFSRHKLSEALKTLNFVVTVYLPDYWVK